MLPEVIDKSPDQDLLKGVESSLWKKTSQQYTYSVPICDSGAKSNLILNFLDVRNQNYCRGTFIEAGGGTEN